MNRLTPLVCGLVLMVMTAPGGFAAPTNYARFYGDKAQVTSQSPLVLQRLSEKLELFLSMEQVFFTYRATSKADAKHYVKNMWMAYGDLLKAHRAYLQWYGNALTRFCQHPGNMMACTKEIRRGVRKNSALLLILKLEPAEISKRAVQLETRQYNPPSI